VRCAKKRYLKKVDRRKKWHYLKDDILKHAAENAGHIGKRQPLNFPYALNANRLNFRIGYARFAVIIAAGR